VRREGREEGEVNGSFQVHIDLLTEEGRGGRKRRGGREEV
jgi:hypothetical protein